MLAEGKTPEGNNEQLRDIIFQCWSRLAVNICFVISRNVSIAVKHNVVNSLPAADRQICLPAAVQLLDGANNKPNKPNPKPNTNDNPYPIN